MEDVISRLEAVAGRLEQAQVITVLPMQLAKIAVAMQGQAQASHVSSHHDLGDLGVWPGTSPRLANSHVACLIWVLPCRGDLTRRL